MRPLRRPLRVLVWRMNWHKLRSELEKEAGSMFCFFLRGLMCDDGTGR